MDRIKENEPQANQQANSEESGIWRRRTKTSSFWRWLTNVGFKKFLNVYGHNYDQNCEADREFVTELWDLDKESWSMVERHERPSARSHKSSWKQISLSAGSSRAEDQRGEPSAAFHKSRSDQNFPDIQCKWRRTQGGATNAAPAILPYSSQLCSAPRQQQFNVSTKRMLSKQNFFDRLRFYYLRFGHLPCFELQFVVVYPYIAARSANGGILVYPAEISITHFTLERGTTSCWSSLVNFEPDFLGCSSRFSHQVTVAENAMVLGVPLMSAQGRCPCEVWRTFLAQYHNQGIVVCDTDQIEIVDRALHFLASTFGPDQLQIHAEIMEKMVTVQDFLSALGSMYYDVIEKPLPAYLTDKGIADQLAIAREARLFLPKCCTYHERKPSNHRSRQHCTVARTTALIEAVCKLCYFGDLLHFRDHYDFRTHSMGSVFVDSPSLQVGRKTSKCAVVAPHHGRAHARHGESVEKNLKDIISRLEKIGPFTYPT